MARTFNRLNARRIATTTKPGRHADGGNLYLAVSESGARSWVFMYRLHGRTKEIGLGSARDLPLARAREIAAGHRAKLAEGLEPVGKRSAVGDSTFGQIAEEVVRSLRPSWRNERHAAQWETTLREYAAPLWRVPVDKITTEHVLTVLRPLWSTRNETASRLRSRIERVLDAAKANGLREGENPARWRGHLDQLLPKKQRLERKHHDAMPYNDLPAFLERLQAFEGVTARALEFCILTASRTNEVLGARRSEFDLVANTWKVPASRMKGGREHIVPLSDRAAKIIASMPEGEFVFPGRFPGSHLSDSMLLHLLTRRMGVDATVHGFRSSFRDWCGDCTHHQRETVEAALAHAIENATEAAYRRSTALQKRRDLMKAWEAGLLWHPAGGERHSI
jgi:integrase